MSFKNKNSNGRLRPEDVAAMDRLIEEEEKKPQIKLLGRGLKKPITPQQKVKLGENLISAVRSGKLDLVKKALDSGADVNYVYPISGLTGLMFAAEMGYLGTVNLLIDNGATIDAKDKTGCTATIGAARYGHFEIVRRLIEKGANIDTTDNSNSTALMFAAQNGHLAVVKHLIENGADVTKTDDIGSTALDIAINSKHYEVARIIDLNRDMGD